MNRCPRGTGGLSPVARGHYRRVVGFAEWAERRVTDRVVGRYLGAYNGYIARVLYSNASSPPLTLEELYDVHQRAHVLTVRDLRGGTASRLRYNLGYNPAVLACEIAGVQCLARCLGRDESEFLRDLGWDAWYRSFARATNLLPGLAKHSKAIGIPAGDEPFWAWVWAVSEANLAVPLLGRTGGDVAYCMTRIGPQLPRLLGCEAQQVKDWCQSPRFVGVYEVESALKEAADFYDLALHTLYRPYKEIDAELDAPFRK